MYLVEQYLSRAAQLAQTKYPSNLFSPSQSLVNAISPDFQTSLYPPEDFGIKEENTVFVDDGRIGIYVLPSTAKILANFTVVQQKVFDPPG